MTLEDAIAVVDSELKKVTAALLETKCQTYEEYVSRWSRREAIQELRRSYEAHLKQYQEDPDE